VSITAGPFFVPVALCSTSHPLRQLIIFDIASRFHMTPHSLLPAQMFVLSFLFLLTYFVHRVADIVQIPCPWIRSERENTEGNRGLIPPHFRVIPDCVTTREPAAPQPSFSIFRSPFSVLFVLSHVCTPRPRSPLPLSIPAVIAHPCPHRLSSPSPSPSPPPHHVNAPTFNANTLASTLLPVPICTFSNLQDCGLSPSPSLSCHLGNIPELGTQAPFCITNWSPPQGVVYLLSVYLPQ